MADVWPLDLPASEKLVLLALADAANDDQKCWPSISGRRPLTKKTSLSERTIQAAIKSLCHKGHLARDERYGVGVIYTVHPRRNDTPANSAPARITALTPATVAPKPSVTINPNVMGAAVACDPAGAGGMWHRLPPGWTPKLLPQALAEQRAIWPAGWEASQLEQFRGWAANAADKDGKGRKRDWDLAWHNWLRREHHESGIRKLGRSD